MLLVIDYEDLNYDNDDVYVYIRCSLFIFIYIFLMHIYIYLYIFVYLYIYYYITILGVNNGDGYVTIVPALLSSGLQQTMIIPSQVSSIAFTVCGAAGGSYTYSSTTTGMSVV